MLAWLTALTPQRKSFKKMEKRQERTDRLHSENDRLMTDIIAQDKSARKAHE